MAKKVYALYHRAPNNDYLHRYGEYKIKISCESHWMEQYNMVEKSDEQIIYYNENYFISFSRTALVKKAREIKAEWLKQENEIIAKIEDIVIK
jgi:hypothetical protein